jgi:hypothetical protein
MRLARDLEIRQTDCKNTVCCNLQPWKLILRTFSYPFAHIVGYYAGIFDVRSVATGYSFVSSAALEKCPLAVYAQRYKLS